MGLYSPLESRGADQLRAFTPAAGPDPAGYWLVVGIYSLGLLAAGADQRERGPLEHVTLHYCSIIPGAFNWYIPACWPFNLLTLLCPLFDRCPQGMATAPRSPWPTIYA
jgi:hypothetical protein